MRMRTKVLPGFILLFCTLSLHLRAQDTAFWFAAPHMSTMPYVRPLNYPTFLAISNGTFQTAHIAITLYNGGNTRTYSADIPPGSLYKHDFNHQDSVKLIENPRDSAGKVVKFGTYIRSDVSVTAYYMQNSADSKDIFTLKGHEALGTLFYVPMQSDNAAKSEGTYEGSDQIDIVATEDDTEVTVIPKARIRLATENSQLAPADTTIVRRLNKGETLKIMEYEYDENPSLAGTKITSDKPIAVTVTEDLVRGDTSGDQIVPVASLGTRYIIPKGYLGGTPPERFYLIGTEDNTTVEIYESGNTPTATLTLHEGTADRRDFSPGINAMYLEADKPVYVYHRSGIGEEGAALLPSVYAIRQNRMSYYQIGGTDVTQRKGFFVFRNGTESGFRISYGSTMDTVLNVGTVYSVPHESDWKVARFDLFPQADNQVVTVENTQSPFSFGYITGLTGNNSYGYFSAFGTFDLPVVTWMCGSEVTLKGGYAMSYLWTYPDGVTTATTPSITVEEEGIYTLEMGQGPTTAPIVAYTTVRKVTAGSLNYTDTTIWSGTAPDPLNVSGASELPDLRYQWQISFDNVEWSNISGATSSTYAPGVLYQTTWYRRGMTSDICAAYTDATEVRVLPRLIPVNPHLRSRVIIP